jgi:hypothetical protein
MQFPKFMQTVTCASIALKSNGRRMPDTITSIPSWPNSMSTLLYANQDKEGLNLDRRRTAIHQFNDIKMFTTVNHTARITP